MGDLSIPRRLESWVAEYDAKIAAIPEAVSAFIAAGGALKAAACVGGVWGEQSLDVGNISQSQIERSLRVSAWRRFVAELKLDAIASAADKKRFDQMLADPLPFDIESIRAVFGDHIQNPRLAILRGMAEVFAGLDPAFKSHEKMKIGVKGLPKRVIIHGFGGFYGGGIDRVRDILNALAQYQGKPLVSNIELTAIERGENGMLLKDGGLAPDPYQNRREREAGEKFIQITARGVWLKRFQNGNGHLFFGPEALRDVNAALAEFYGDVLPDCQEAEPKRRASTDISKDLQFYPTPKAVVDRVLSDCYRLEGARVLEPSCGDGRFMDALRARGANVVGCEVDAVRAAQCEAKGHKVMRMNFLETEPTPSFDFVIMNPPFYGKHYAKHVLHALRFLKQRGVLKAVLPITARYDHGLLDDLGPNWTDLPVGAFSESGTNICTTIATITAPA